MKAGTNLEKVLAGGQFAVTAEAGPPKGTGAASVQKKGELLRHCCDAVNVTDNQTAIVFSVVPRRYVRWSGAPRACSTGRAAARQTVNVKYLRTSPVPGS